MTVVVAAKVKLFLKPTNMDFSPNMSKFSKVKLKLLKLILEVRFVNPKATNPIMGMNTRIYNHMRYGLANLV
jgi:hypothetical protein